ncbi:MAG: hypothetical protein P4N59_33035 [Negativicutes bacterium]|nr:hypothetical protein [Negativicutes bacterium]
MAGLRANDPEHYALFESCAIANVILQQLDAAEDFLRTAVAWWVPVFENYVLALQKTTVLLACCSTCFGCSIISAVMFVAHASHAKLVLS